MSAAEQPKQAFPLSWPLGWPRTPVSRRARAPFSKRVAVAGQVWKSKQSLNVSDGYDRLSGELRRLSARSVTISTNLQTKADGTPYMNQGKMLADPGVAVYFTLKGKALALACDKWSSCAENMAALAGHIEAIRACDRYGVGSIEQAFAGYKALPADSAADWRQVLGFPAGALPTEQAVDSAYKREAMIKHPDKGGTDAGMAHLNRARDFALEELRLK